MDAVKEKDAPSVTCMDDQTSESEVGNGTIEPLVVKSGYKESENRTK